MIGMSTRKRQPQSETTEPKKPNRKGESLTVWIRDDVVASLNQYIDSTHPTVTRRSTVEAALEDFLASKGFPPAKRKPRES